MNRIIKTVVALGALLAFGSVSSAAVIVYNVSGTGSLQTISSLAPIPPGYFLSPFATGSSLTVNTDTNGDGTAGDVSLVSGTLRTVGTTDLGPYGTVISDVTTTLSGGTGVLSGEDILWSDPAGTAISSTGTFGCTGAICTLFGITQGVVYPIQLYAAITAAGGTWPLNPIRLGTWDISGPDIVGSSEAVFGFSTTTGAAIQYYVFGPTDLGLPAPEPGVFALMALGLGGLALRARKA